MIRKLLLLGLLIFVFLLELSAERKKVGLVLSGGGAKGLAHIGAIQVLEKAGIPIDYIVGTSMGSIVGGLYAIGYSADSLDRLVRSQDWGFLLGDKVQRRDLAFNVKESTEKYILSFPFGNDRKTRLPSGFIQGQNVYNLFSNLTVGYHDSLNFLELPIPFACVTTNIANGQEVVLKNGNLVQSMRASMAIPGAFSPVILDSMVLVDGGIVNNYPVDVARAMGAEIIIGVDVQSELLEADKLNSARDIMGQLMNLLCLKKYDENLKATDLLIKPDVRGYSAASFQKDAINILISNGREAAETKWNELIELKKKIGVEDTVQPSPIIVETFSRDTFSIRHIYLRGVTEKDAIWLRKIIRIEENSLISKDELNRVVSSLYGSQSFMEVTYRLLGGPVYDLELSLKENPMNLLNLGFRFDTEEMAAILLNTKFNYRALWGSRFSLTGRLSKNPYVRLDYTFEKQFLRRINLAYMFRYNDFNINNKGHRASNVTYRYHLGELSLTDIYIRNLKFQVGLRYEYYDYDAFLYKEGNQAVDVKSKGYVSYYALAHLETFDSRYYPRKGISFKAEYSLYTDNFVTYLKHAPFSALSADFSGVIPLTNRTQLLPGISGRVLIGHDVAYPYMNYMGGYASGRYAPQQLPFWGISHIEKFDNSLIMATLKLRQRMGSKHYVFAVGNVALQDNQFFDLLGNDLIWGGGAGYSYHSLIGPIDVNFGISNWTDRFGVYFNLGFYF